MKRKKDRSKSRDKYLNTEPTDQIDPQINNLDDININYKDFKNRQYGSRSSKLEKVN